MLTKGRELILGNIARFLAAAVNLEDADHVHDLLAGIQRLFNYACECLERGETINLDEEDEAEWWEGWQ